MINSPLNPDYLPPKALELAETIGLPALQKLVEWRGGVTIYIPTPGQLSREHPLAMALGMHAALALAEEYNGGRLEVPRCDASVQAALHEEIRARRRSGEPESKVAQDVGMWGRSIRRICAAEPKNDNQGDLFE